MRKRATGVAFLALAGAVLGVLSGCALPRMVESEVQSFTTSTAVAVAPASYRFERLPSQLGSASQDLLEELAAQAAAGRAHRGA